MKVYEYCHSEQNYSAPLLTSTYLLLLLPIDPALPLHQNLFIHTYPKVAVIQCISVTRAFRSVWQSTTQTLFDVSLTHLIFTAFPTGYTLRYLGEFVVLLLISFSRDRITQLANKLYFFTLLLVTSIAHKKQRRTSSPILVSLSAILFPLILIVICLSALLSAPLLALFTIPVFVIGFPRPKRFWPQTSSGGSVCADTIYYQQLNPALKTCLGQLFANGSIGDPTAGDYYIVRLQDKLSWITILERGYGFCTVNVKGLELQETSCHTIEASQLDNIFKSAFDRSDEGCVNPYSFSVVTPMDTVYINTYSSTRNVLTGVIDSADNYQSVFVHLQKTLIWVLVKHVRDMKQRELTKQLKQLNTFHDKSQTGKKLEKKGSVISIRSIGKQSRVSPAFEMSDDEISRPSTASSVKQKNRSASRDSSIRSFSESIFSDEFNEARATDTRTTGYGSRVNKHRNSKSYGSMSPPQNISVFSKDIESFSDDLHIGLPVLDISEMRPVPKPAPLIQKLPKINTTNVIYKPITNLANSAEFTSPYSVNFSIPMKWRELPVDSSQLQKPNFKFPVEWYNKVLRSSQLKVVGKSEQEVYEDLENDEVLRNAYCQLTMACSSVFESSGNMLSSVPTAHKLYKCYMGELPCNAMMDWLTEERDLFSLVLKAFRYAFKLMLDEFAYGAIDDDDELMSYLRDYDTRWYIGVDDGTEWSNAVLTNVPNLFALGRVTTKGVYTSRMLTTQHLPIHIARLNPEVIRGQWANLALELYYLTNDDDERYSIQAHPSILRNLTVQAADPPLGYPIFSSPPMSIPTL